jgi:hypothetical protein
VRGEVSGGVVDSYVEGGIGRLGVGVEQVSAGSLFEDPATRRDVGVAEEVLVGEDLRRCATVGDPGDRQPELRGRLVEEGVYVVGFGEGVGEQQDQVAGAVAGGRPRTSSTTLVRAAICALIGGTIGAAGGWTWATLSAENQTHCARITNNGPCGGAGFVLIDLPVTVAAMSVVACAVMLPALTIPHLQPRAPLVVACLTLPALSSFAYRLLIPHTGMNPDPRGALIPTLVMAVGSGSVALLSRLHQSPERAHPGKPRT